ncbi:MAG: glycosyltransferase family 2 protein [Bacteroidota bacterium]|nr:glycosyltransferase family 2 protein [Bacteroidota bacterium]
MPAVTVIIPVFDEEQNIVPLYEEIAKQLSNNDELIFVDDGSIDKTFLEIQYLSNQDKRVKCISLSRNFGHQNALMAGLQHATGDYMITMDGDLQHPPEIIAEMITKLDEGFDIVITKRNKTGNISLFKKIYSALFYRFINAVSETHIEPNASDFRAFNKKVLDSILLFKERELFLRGIFSWVGFKTTTITFDAAERKNGKTKYSFGKMMRLALKGITSFSFKPLRVAILIGCIISLAAFIFAIFAMVAYFKGDTVPGWASIIIAIMFLGGTQFLAIGLLGEYIASLFIESKNRPLFLIDKKINLD